MTRHVVISDEVWNALLDMKRRNFTFDDVIRELLELSEVYVPETYDGR